MIITIIISTEHYTTYLCFALLDIITHSIAFVEITADGIWWIESASGSAYCVKCLHLCSPSECSLRD